MKDTIKQLVDNKVEKLISELSKQTYRSDKNHRNFYSLAQDYRYDYLSDELESEAVKLFFSKEVDADIKFDDYIISMLHPTIKTSENNIEFVKKLKSIVNSLARHTIMKKHLSELIEVAYEVDERQYERY